MQPDNNASLSWTRPSDLRDQVQKLWNRGRILASFVNGQSLFPKRLALRTPTSADMTERFDDVRAWIQELLATAHCRVEMRPFRHRILGSNLAPNEAWIDTVQDALALIGKQRDASRFCAVLEATRQQQPDLLDWLLKHPRSEERRVGKEC